MNKNNQHEIALVEEAISGRPEKLRTYLEPLVRNMATAYELGAKRAYPWIVLTEDDLERVAWMSLEPTLHKYAERILHLNMRERGKVEMYDFSSYFAWCMRQAMLEQISRHMSES